MNARFAFVRYISGRASTYIVCRNRNKRKPKWEKFRIDFDQMKIGSVQMRRTDIHLKFDAPMNEMN